MSSASHRPLQPAMKPSQGGELLKRPAASNHGDGETDVEGDHKEGKRRRVKRNAGKACVYCRRSHMVCEGGRPCERCIKRDIAHLCRDVTPPPSHHPARRHSDQHHPDVDLRRGSSTVSPPHTSVHLPPFHSIDPTQSSGNMSVSQQQQQQQPLPTSLYSDSNFPPAWPLLPDTAGPATFDGGANGGMQTDDIQSWGMNDESELGALSKFLGDMGVPSLPGSFLDVLNYFSRGGQDSQTIPPMQSIQPTFTADPTPAQGLHLATSQSQTPDLKPALGDSSGTSADGGEASGSSSRPGLTRNGSGKGKEKIQPGSGMSGVSRIERYFLAAADQPSGPRASRLAQVIKAKYDAGLLKPYDYIKGYERMNKWMDSGRAAPKTDNLVESAPSSPQKRPGRLPGLTPIPAYGSSISPESRRRILAALNGFRPKFRQIARTLTDVDLVFVEEAMERWMLEYDRAFASIHTPSCIWRRTGEIQKANQEFSNLTGIPANMFRNGQLCVYELMDEDSAVRYWEGYAKIAFDAGQRSLYTSCTLKIPLSLTQRRAAPSSTPASILRHIPDLALPQPMFNGEMPDSGTLGPVGAGTKEQYREVKCCFSVTIRRDAWGVPVAIMGQWIPM